MKIKILLATLILVVMAIAQSARAVAITVTNTNDSGPGSLRQALADANDGDTINFSISGTITLATGFLAVNADVIIDGPGANILAVDGNHSGGEAGVFYITSGKIVTISGLTITNGSGRAGGAIQNQHATLTISNCTLSNNSAGNGGAIWNDGSYSGS